MNVLAYMLSAPLARGPYPDLASWAERLRECPFRGHVERALWSGFHADRLGYAFVGGYRAALARLLEHAAVAQGLPVGRSPLAPHPEGLTCLAATESGGAHPRAIATRLEKRGGALILDGEKTYATLATASEEMLVVASRGVESDGKNRLRVVRVRRDAGGVEITPRPVTPFAPEVPHARVRLTGVVVEPEDVLPGDGYATYLKPFRTIEDVHVLASTLGYLLGAGRAYDFAREPLTELVSLALSVVDAGARDASAPLTHVVLAGIFGAARRTAAALEREWAKADADERARWERDAPLLLVAEAARQKRTETAWAALAGR